MSLPHGGHLSHGHVASITSKCFQFKHYRVDTQTETIDYDEVRRMALECRPKMIVAGASAYPRLIDYEKMAAIAEEVSAYLLADMAHFGGLVAAEMIPSPVPFCDFVTFTCYKTMMGGRGGVILCRDEYGARINKAIFPGCQGTSAVNSIAAKAIIFQLFTEPFFRKIQRRTLDNAGCLAQELAKRGYRIVTGSTENHQVIVDLHSTGLKGDAAEKILESIGIITNRNVIPRDTDIPGSVSGLRLGTAAIAAREMGEREVIRIAGLIDKVLKNHDQKEVLSQAGKEVVELCRAFPVYGRRKLNQ
jgi:glycine hydroxymethyltransferase